MKLPHSPDANTAIGTIRLPESSFSKSTACPKSKSEETWGSHISLVVVMTCENVSLLTNDQPAASSGCTFGNRPLFSIKEDLGAVSGEATVVLVAPVYDIRDA